jgi:hypothetical protein
MIQQTDLPPSRRARRAADAALRAHLRRRDRIDRFGREAFAPAPAGLVGRVLSTMVPRI